MNDKNNVIKLPISFKQRIKNEFGPRFIPCEVSPRWIQFEKVGSIGSLIHVDVMTINKEKVPRKLCDLVFSAISDVKF
jgi:hypothetical protein